MCDELSQYIPLVRDNDHFDRTRVDAVTCTLVTGHTSIFISPHFIFYFGAIKHKNKTKTKQNSRVSRIVSE